MNKSIRRILMTLFSSALLIGGLSACAHRAGGPAGPGSAYSAEDVAKFRSKMIERASSMLDLNADQKTRLSGLADKVQESRLAMRGSAGQVGSGDPRSQMQALIAGEKFDRTKAQGLVAEKITTINARSPELITAFGDFYDSLNPTQQQKVRDFMQHGRGRGHRG